MSKIFLAVAGILQKADGKVLISERPVGKSWAGYWEFPGGKIEPDESPEQALLREMQEEIGVVPLSFEPYRFLTAAREEGLVVVLCYLCNKWQGTPEGHEAQALAWVLPETLDEYKMLPSNAAIVAALQNA